MEEEQFVWELRVCGRHAPFKETEGAATLARHQFLFPEVTPIETESAHKKSYGNFTLPFSSGMYCKSINIFFDSACRDSSPIVAAHTWVLK